MASLANPSLIPVTRITRARLPTTSFSTDALWDISLEGSRISEIEKHIPDSHEERPRSKGVVDANGRQVTESFCHAHVHLDKAFLFSHEKYSDLLPRKGDFAEAMELGKEAKGLFERVDLLQRGSWLIAESVAAGVSTMRVFVEIDHIVGKQCLDAAVELKVAFKDVCDLQICAFAQNPIFSGPFGDQDRQIWEEAISNPEVEVLGSTPYVEDASDTSRKNYEYVIGKCQNLGKHLDLHLDYNIDPEQPAMTLDVVDYLKESWHNKQLVVTLGHCTRLTLMDAQELSGLRQKINELGGTQIHFVGLPTSDLFIQGRPQEGDSTGQRPRGTLQILDMIEQHNFNAAISINNIGNQFTPQGSCDLLALASWCVGVYQSGAQTRRLFECISARALEAIAKEPRGIQEGAVANLVIFGDNDNKRLSGSRPRISLADLVFSPPGERQVIFQGNLVEV